MWHESIGCQNIWITTLVNIQEIPQHPGNSEDLLFFSQNVPSNHICPELDAQKLWHWTDFKIFEFQLM
jgi:hypothetical protein